MTELTTGPLASQIAPHLASGDAGAIHNLLTNRNIPVIGNVSWSDFTTWLASGPMLAVTTKATTSGDPLEPSAQVLLMVVQSGNPLELSNVNVRTLFDYWVIQGGITQTEHDILMTLAQTNVSRAEQISGIDTSLTAIGVAINGGDIWP